MSGKLLTALIISIMLASITSGINKNQLKIKLKRGISMLEFDYKKEYQKWKWDIPKDIFMITIPKIAFLPKITFRKI